MQARRLILVLSLTMIGLLAVLPVAAQTNQTDPMAPPNLMPPPPRPPKPKPENVEEIDENLSRYSPDSETPWVLPEEMLNNLAQSVLAYEQLASRLSCDESARLASYDDNGIASKEKIRRYAYLLEPSPQQGIVIEHRSSLNKAGEIKKEAVKDEEPFPPAYAWVYLFSESNQPFFDYRLVRDGFDGFDWIKEIQFRGALGFSDGKDIRQWEGTILIDATSWTPLEIYAQPSNQDEKIDAQYRQWASSFNIVNYRTGPKPFVYRSHAKFRKRENSLTFPTELRYDKLRAVSRDTMVRINASIRTYSNYQFFGVESGKENILGTSKPSR